MSTITEAPVSGAPEIVGQRPSAPTQVLPSSRLISLDAFRGITIAGMLLVNNPGSWGAIYPPLKHAEWNGWTPTDLIFPFFLFIVGVAMTYSFGKLIENGASRRDLLLKTAKRSLLIFLVGLAIHSFPWWGYDYSHLRIPGVLQRIAIAYLFASAIYLYTGLRGQIVAIATLLIGYWAVQVMAPVGDGISSALNREWISERWSIARFSPPTTFGSKAGPGIRKGWSARFRQSALPCSVDWSARGFAATDSRSRRLSGCSCSVAQASSLV